MKAETNGCFSKEICDRDKVADALRQLTEPGQVFEIRALNATMTGGSYSATYSGYFNDPQIAADAVTQLRSATGVYFTLNPARPELMARAHNRMRRAPKGESTGDKDILRRKWFPVDCDPIRPSGISSSDSEHEAAAYRAQEIEHYLYDMGWPLPYRNDSGNGAHLLYPIDLPVYDGDLTQRSQEALSARFTDASVKVDTSVFNPARIWKLPGTLTCKGDDCPDRPHRMAEILHAPDYLQVVSRGLLEELASMASSDKKQQQQSTESRGTAPFDLAAFVRRSNLEVDGPFPWNGGQKWTFKTSPLCEHHGDGPFIAQFGNGAITAGCHHDSCSWNWKDLRKKFEPGAQRQNDRNREQEQAPQKPIAKYSFAQLTSAFPCMNPAVVDGLFREGETVNIIADPKMGKSWLAYQLALSIITGQDWLGFPTHTGKVLLIDNELHPQTLAGRIPRVAEQMGLFRSDWEGGLDVWPLRGNLQPLHRIAEELDQIGRRHYKSIILDAKYRFSVGQSENDNAAETALYNLIDQIANLTDASLQLIHHSSKGSQSDKRVTDVGAGAGAQSRAADCHIVLREHEDEGVVVLAAAVRSFPPVEPVALRWEFPLWIPCDADTGRLKGKLTGQELRQQARDKEGTDLIVKALRKGPATMRELRRKTGLSKDRAERLIDKLYADRQLSFQENSVKGNLCREFRLPESDD